ncbi:MAG: hypothetical protein IRY85_17230 [Micromonosporaceae bacterium]|nr:hypothetical protein [Micromonosporaceae bacterium]
MARRAHYTGTVRSTGSLLSTVDITNCGSPGRRPSRRPWWWRGRRGFPSCGHSSPNASSARSWTTGSASATRSRGPLSRSAATRWAAGRRSGPAYSTTADQCSRAPDSRPTAGGAQPRARSYRRTVSGHAQRPIPRSLPERNLRATPRSLPERNLRATPRSLPERNQRVILFLDVDGVLIPYGNQAAPDSATVLFGGPEADEELLSRIDPTLGPRLLSLGCELVWATGWEDDANEVISPRVGLPQLPVLAWSFDSLEYGPAGLHWKTRDLIAWAGGRPFVWVDDEISTVDRDWVALDYAGHALLHRVDSRTGLTEDDLDAIERWLDDLSTVD